MGNYQRKSRDAKELRKLRSLAALKRWDAMPNKAERAAQQNTRPATLASRNNKPRTAPTETFRELTLDPIIDGA